MKVTVVMVMTVDGKTTKGDNPHIYSWTSNEDQKHFFSLLQQQNLIVMGSKTFHAARKVIQPTPALLRVVLTKYPEKYKTISIKGQIEFTNEHPKQLISRLEKQGYKKMLVVGGSVTNFLFFKYKLVQEVYLTIEPKIFGNGKSLIDGKLADVALSLVSVRKLNERGTLLLKYKVNN